MAKFHQKVLPALFTILLSPLCSPAQQHTIIYLSPNGNDAFPGTAAKPLATLTAARDRSRILRKQEALVEIRINAGTYQLKAPLLLTPEDGNLLFKGQGAKSPVFSGGVQLPAFEKVNAKRWKVRIPAAYDNDTVQQVFINGNRVVRARTPNEEWFKTKQVKETLTDTVKRSGAQQAIQQIRLTTPQWNALQAVPDSALPEVIISVHHAWDLTRKYIRGRSALDSGVSITGKPMQPWNKLDNSSLFIFENAKQFLDAPGEWWIDPQHILWYIPRDGETITNTRATIPVIDQFIQIKGDSNRKATEIRFENISFQYSRYTMPPSGDAPSQGAAPIPAVIMVEDARHIQFDHCEISHTGISGIWFKTGCTDSKITHCYFHDLGAGGVKIGDTHLPQNESAMTGNIIVDNNIFRAGGRVFPTGIGVTIFHAGDNTVMHNEIADFYYTGISVGWVWGYSYSPAKRNIIRYNHIHDLGQGLLSDMGGVYTLGLSEGTVVSNNVIHDIYSYGYGGWGLYTDEGSTGVLMENNLVYHCKSAAFHQHYGENNVIRNNIFVSQVKAQLQATRVEHHCSFYFTGNIIYFDTGNLMEKPGWERANFQADSNCYWNPRTKDIQFGQQSFSSWQSATGKDKNSIIADPGFVNVARNDFHINNTTLMARIGFEPFDWEKAGVYGETTWKQLANVSLGQQKYPQE